MHNPYLNNRSCSILFPYCRSLYLIVYPWSLIIGEWQLSLLLGVGIVVCHALNRTSHENEERKEVAKIKRPLSLFNVFTTNHSSWLLECNLFWRSLLVCAECSSMVSFICNSVLSALYGLLSIIFYMGVGLFYCGQNKIERWQQSILFHTLAALDHLSRMINGFNQVDYICFKLNFPLESCCWMKHMQLCLWAKLTYYEPWEYVGCIIWTVYD